MKKTSYFWICPVWGLAITICYLIIFLKTIVLHTICMMHLVEYADYK